MKGFYGKTYRNSKNKVIGIHEILCGKLYVLASYDPKTKEWKKYNPTYESAEQMQALLDKYAQILEMPEVLA